MGPGLTARAFLVLFSAMLVLVLACGLALRELHRRAHEAAAVTAGRMVCRLVAQEADGAATGRGAGRLAAVVRTLARLERIEQVLVVSPQGRPLFRAGRDGDLRAVPADGDGADPVALPLGIAGARRPMYSGTGGRLRFWAPVRRSPDRILAYVGVDLARDPQWPSAAAVAAAAAAVLSTAAILSLLAAVMVSRFAAAPLARILGEIDPRPGEGGPAARGHGELVTRIEALLRDLDEKHRAMEERAAASSRELVEARIQMRQTMHEIREVQAQVVQAEKMAALGLLVSGVAHEINNTMNIISGALPPLAMQVEKLRWADGEERRRTLANLETLMGNIREGAARTSEIVRHLQDFSRSRPTEHKETDPCRILDTTLFLMRPRLEGGIEVIREYESRGATLPCYPGQLGQVFMNIILNSVQALGDRGRLLVRTGIEDGRFVIAIADDGPGIAPEIRERVFDPFFTTKEAGQGTGLGLSVTYAIVREHRGDIRITPSPFGRGCQFRITLPMGPE